jgi:hypothetical protein
MKTTKTSTATTLAEKLADEAAAPMSEAITEAIQRAIDTGRAHAVEKLAGTVNMWKIREVKPTEDIEALRELCFVAYFPDPQAVRPQWNRRDIATAHYMLEVDYNSGGILQERPSNRRRMMSSDYQLKRAGFKDLYSALMTPNAQRIYTHLERRYLLTGEPVQVSAGTIKQRGEFAEQAQFTIQWQSRPDVYPFSYARIIHGRVYRQGYSTADNVHTWYDIAHDLTPEQLQSVSVKACPRPHMLHDIEAAIIAAKNEVNLKEVTP